ncbi:MAG: alpha/beta fold hydrolase [Gammaproteobacteria bacterium]
MSAFRKGYADGPDGQVHFLDTGRGSGATTLVLLHQTPCHLGMFSAVYPLLAAAGIRAIGIDTPGYGQSAPTAETPTIDGYASAVLAVLDHLAVPATIVLGHHTGASIAAELAVKAPARVSRVILNGPPLFTAEERSAYLQAIAAAPRPELKADGSHLQAIWDRRAHFTPGWTNVAAMHKGVVMMLSVESRERSGYSAAFSHDIGVPLQAITQPGLILTNTGDDLYVAACRARDRRPDFGFVALEGGTHDIVDEQPAAWAAAVVTYCSGSAAETA